MRAVPQLPHYRLRKETVETTIIGEQSPRPDK